MGETTLRGRAAGYAGVALDNIVREYPNDLRHLTTGPDDRPRPRDVHPAFYGSYDWHSCVEMHWLLVRLLRCAPGEVSQARIRAALDAHLTPRALAAEAAYLADPARRTFSRPYGWGWALTLVEEVDALAAGDPDATRWAHALRPLADVLVARYLVWLPLADYPIRYGVHTNSAFGLSRALGHARRRARAGDPALLSAITGAAHRWYGRDAGYPAGWEPAGSDFLSPALVEAELMACLLDAPGFAGWLDRFLPGLAGGEPAALFAPAVVADPTDAQIAHLHGLNLSRAWCWRRLAAALPGGDPRIPAMAAAADRHAGAALDAATGGDYVVDHWLAAYAVLLLS